MEKEKKKGYKTTFYYVAQVPEDKRQDRDGGLQQLLFFFNISLHKQFLERNEMADNY